MTLQGFDSSYYLNAKLADLTHAYPEWGDKDAAFLEGILEGTYGLTAEMHYSLAGYKEGLSPNAFFNHDEYRFAKARDLVSRGISPSMESALNSFDAAWQKDSYLHYLEFGAAEGINPSNRFDESQYLTDKLSALQTDGSTHAQWADKTIDDLRGFLTSAGMTIVDHYLNFGAKEGLTATIVPASERVDPTYRPWELPHADVTLPSNLSLDWVNSNEITTLPHKAIGQVMTTIDHQSWIGTGFLISPQHVLTSAHVLLNDTGELNANADISFSPGLNGEARTAASYAWEKAWVERTFDSNLYQGWPDNDLAVIKLNQPIGDTIGYMKLEPAINGSLTGTSVKSAGYSAGSIEQDNPVTPGQDYYQWEVSGTVDQYIFSNGGLELSDSMAVTPGASGSPVYYAQTGNFYFTGVLAGTLGDTTVAAAMDTDSYNWILGILQLDGYYPDYILG